MCKSKEDMVTREYWANCNMYTGKISDLEYVASLLLGRIAMVKMVFLPKLFFYFYFYFLNVALKVPHEILGTIQGIISKSVWGNKRPPISARILEKTIEEGRLAIPNIMSYYHASLLTVCLDWWQLPSNDINLVMKQNVLRLSLVDWLVSDKK